LLLFFLSVFSLFRCGSSSAGDLPVVIFVPGYSGSQLYVTVELEENVPTECLGANIPVGEPFLAMINVSLDLRYPQCLYKLLTVRYDTETKTFSNQPGVTVSVRDFGGFSGISPVYHSFSSQLEKWGYVLGVNAFGAPYDYRYMFAPSLASSGFVNQLKLLVENAYEKNGKLKSVLIGHSNGGPTLYSFLEALDAEWTDKYLCGFITLSGNMLGQMNMIRSFVYSKDINLQNMVTSWEASFGSTPWGEYEALRGFSTVTTHSGSRLEKNYSAISADVVDLFRSANRSDWVEKYIALTPSMNRTRMPSTSCYCLYGSDVPTTYSYVFAGDINARKYVAEREIPGDGNQDHVDNEMCSVWANQNVGNSTNFKFVSKAFTGVHHMQMYTDDDVLSYVYDILTSLLQVV